MNVICLQEDALIELIDQVYQKLEKKHGLTKKWLNEEEAMKELNVGKTRLTEMRKNNEIGFSQKRKKNIVYDRDSINDYHKRHYNPPKISPDGEKK